MSDYAGLIAALDETSNLFDELTTRELDIIWEHTFQKIPTGEGNGITDKFFDYDSAVTRSGPDVRVGEGEYIRTKETGDYGAGQPVLAGAAGQFSQAPQSDQDGWVGYYDRGAGIGGGFGYQHFTDGEAGATSAGEQPYVFLERNGGGRDIVPQENWNINTLDGTQGEGPALDPTFGFTWRGPHACYGHAAFVHEIGVKTDKADADIRYAGDAFKLYPAHVFTDTGDTMFHNFDVPIEWRVTGTQANGFTLDATACHYEGERGRKVKRANGQGWTPQFNSGSNISLAAHPDWTYIMSLRRRSGWDGVDLTPLELTINADQNIEVQLTARGSFSNTSYGLPENTSVTECAAEYDLKTYDLSAESEKSTDTSIDTDGEGEREWYDVIPGDKQEPISVGDDLDNVVVATDEPMALLARPATGNATDIRYAALRNGGGF